MEARRSQGETAATPGVGGATQRFVPDMDIPQQWWALFRSPALNKLVEQALKENPNVTAAQAALRQAHELYLAQRATLIPARPGQLRCTRAKNAIGTVANPTSLPQVNPYYNLYTAQLSVSYLPDVFGTTRRTIEAAKAQAASARFQLEATRPDLEQQRGRDRHPGSLAPRSDRGDASVCIELQHQLTATVARSAGARNGERARPARSASRRRSRPSRHCRRSGNSWHRPGMR